MRDPARKACFLRGDIIDVNIVVIARHTGEVDDVSLGHRHPRSQKMIAYLNVVQTV